MVLTGGIQPMKQILCKLGATLTMSELRKSVSVQ